MAPDQIDSLALRADGVDLTYRQLEAEVAARAEELIASGVRPGTLHRLFPEPGIEFAVALHAVFRIGAVAWLGGAPEPPIASGAACRLETSGTTGVPRTIDLTQANFSASAAGSAKVLGATPADRWLCCLPVRHVAGLSILTRAAAGRSVAVIHPDFDVDRVAASLAEDGVTLVSLVATQLARLLDAEIDISGPRALILGGGPVPLELIEEAHNRGATVIQSYGMTETCSQVALLEPAAARQKTGSAGRALPGAELRIDAGQIMVRGAMVSPSAELEDGWLRTGDLGRLDEDGFLWVEGRSDDLIVTGGENVMPEEVEAALRSHPEVADAAVIGRPDPEWQEAVTAVVVLRPGAGEDADALRAHCAGELAGYKVPKEFEFVAELPRAASGKLLRRILR